MKLGYVLPIAEDDATKTTPRYAEIRDLALGAEAAGFDSIWVFDHLLFRFPDHPTVGIWECWTLLTALAEATNRVELGTIVLCAPFRNPAVLAKMADTLDEISDGRLILGLGAGWHQPEFDAFGVPFDHLASRFENYLQIVVPLLRDGTANVTGAHYSAANAELRPRGPRPSGPPILVASFKPRMLGLTAQYADAWNTAWLGQPTKLAERRAALDAACAKVGRDPATVETTVGVNVRFPDLLPATDEPIDPDKTLVGTAAEIAATFRAYADQGGGHLICSCEPNTTEGQARLAEAVRLYQAG